VYVAMAVSVIMFLIKRQKLDLIYFPETNVIEQELITPEDDVTA